MYTAMDLARLAFYAALYAGMENGRGASPDTMIAACRYYLDRLRGVDHAGFERLIRDIENMLAGVMQ